MDPKIEILGTETPISSSIDQPIKYEPWYLFLVYNGLDRSDDYREVKLALQGATTSEEPATTTDTDLSGDGSISARYGVSAASQFEDYQLYLEDRGPEQPTFMGYFNLTEENEEIWPGHKIIRLCL